MNFSKPYLCGYYGMSNTGDDALLLAAAWGAREFLGAKEFKVNCHQPVQVADIVSSTATLSEPQSFRGENRLRQYFMAMSTQSVIFGGGSVLHTAQDINIKRDIIRFTGRGSSAALGVGIGPFKNVEAEKSCGKFLNECGFVGVRDKESFAQAKTLAPNANVRLTFDLAPGLLRIRAAKKTTEREGLCVCLCPVESLSGNIELERQHIDNIAKMVRRIYKTTGESVTLLDLNGHETLGDSIPHSYLRMQIGPDVPVKHLRYQQDPLSVLDTLATFNLVVSMRLHGSILAYLAETPVISLNYHSKCEGWCEQVGMSEDMQYDSDDIDQDKFIETVYRGLSEGFPSPLLRIGESVRRSLTNWSFDHGQLIKQNFCSHSSL